MYDVEPFVFHALYELLRRVELGNINTTQSVSQDYPDSAQRSPDRLMFIKGMPTNEPTFLANLLLVIFTLQVRPLGVRRA